MSTSNNTTAILQTRELYIPAVGMSPSMRLNYQLMPTEFHLIYSPDQVRSGSFTDALLGLADGTRGEAVFKGRTWHTMHPDKALQARREIGRVQSHGNWMETLSVMENILLPLLHHSVVPESELIASASDMARRFGLPGLPTDLPASCADIDLEKCACIRAFHGRPALVMLEHPTNRVGTQISTALISAIQQVRRRKGAVVWLTEHQEIANNTGIPASHRWRMAGSQLLKWEHSRAHA